MPPSAREIRTSWDCQFSIQYRGWPLYPDRSIRTTSSNGYNAYVDQLNYFWIVEKKNLEDRRAVLRNKERELQDIEEKHQVGQLLLPLLVVECTRCMTHSVYDTRVTARWNT